MIKISTESLNTALGFVKPGLSANSYIQLASTVSFIVKDNVLYFVTEPDDGEVKYQTKVCAVEVEDISVAVNGTQLIQAVGTCSGENVMIDIQADRIALDNGRGALYLPLLIDDDGNPVFNTLGEVDGELVKVTNTETLKLATSCISGTMDNLAIRNIYCNQGLTLTSDLVNIAKGPEVLDIEVLVTGRMREFLLKYPECKFMNSDSNFTLVSGKHVAIFTKVFQDYIEEFPVAELKAEFEQNKEHSFTVDMAQLLNALSFLKVTANSVNDYAVKLTANGPDSVKLESDYGSAQVLKVTWLTEENQPWSVFFDCVSALARFASCDGVRQIDIYASQIACVGPVEVSLGLIEEEM